MSDIIRLLKSAIDEQRRAAEIVQTCWDVALSTYPDDAELAELMGRTQENITLLRQLRSVTLLEFVEDRLS